jgi:heme/copper-type cytochrome/quinol oxidase subunit 3
LSMIYHYMSHLHLFSNIALVYNMYFFLIFVLSEVMFFFFLFWSLFWNLSSLDNYNIVIHSHNLNYSTLPLLNTILLLTSAFLSIALLKLYVSGVLSLNVLSVIFLGLFFFFVQVFEYNVCMFSINSNLFYSLFFLLTGFHGFHVFLGLISFLAFLSVYLTNWVVLPKYLVCIDLYWHFVDVIWVLVFFFIYIGFYIK